MNKKRNRIIVSVTVAVVVFIACLSIFKIRSVENYHDVESPLWVSGPGAELVIDCRSALDNWDLLDEGLKDEKYVPSSGYILEPTKLQLQEGDTAYDLLVRVARYYEIPLDAVGAEDSPFGSAYISGINNLYENSCGDMSGWMFTVNGEYPDTGCDSYEVQDGDVICFEYSVWSDSSEWEEAA